MPAEECSADKSVKEIGIGLRPDENVICARRGIFDQALELQGIVETAQGAACTGDSGKWLRYSKRYTTRNLVEYFYTDFFLSSSHIVHENLTVN